MTNEKSVSLEIKPSEESEENDLATACQLSATMGFMLVPAVPWLKNSSGKDIVTIHKEFCSICRFLMDHVNAATLSDDDRSAYVATITLLQNLANDLFTNAGVKEILEDVLDVDIDANITDTIHDVAADVAEKEGVKEDEPIQQTSNKTKGTSRTKNSAKNSSTKHSTS